MLFMGPEMPSQQAVYLMTEETWGFLQSKGFIDMPYVGMPQKFLDERTTLFMELHGVVKKILELDACEKF